MAETSKNKIYYNDNENIEADVLTDMKKMAESTDEAIEKSKYNDAAIKKSISDVEKKQVEKNIEQDSKIVELQTEKAKLETELKEMQEDFYQNSIRGQASGEYIHVEDSSNCRARIGISGNSEQETRSGKNKLACPANFEETTLGIKVKQSNGIYSITGTITSAGTCMTEKTIDNYTIESGDYLHLNNNVIENRVAFVFVFTDGTVDSISLAEINRICNLENKVGKTISKVRIYCNTKDVNLSFEIKPMICKDSAVTDFEQYGVAPSPDYPAEIKTVGSNVQVFDKNNVNKLNAFINGETKVISSWENCKTLYIPCLKNKYYTVTKKGTRFIVGTTTNVPSINTNCNQISADNTAKSITIKTLDIDKYLVVFYYNSGSDTLTEQEILDSIKIVEGTEVGEYSKYGQGCVKVTKCNTNLYDGKNEVGGINNDGSLSSTTDRWRTINYINVKSLKNLIIRVYDIETSGALGRYCLYDDKYNFLSSAQILNTKTDLKVDNASYLKFWFLNEKVASSAQVQVQVEEGTTAKEYNKHEEQSYIMPVQQEMLENDYFDYDNEEEVHTWGKLVLNGTEKIGISGASTDEILAVVYDINNAIDGFGYSNCFLYSSQAALNKLNVYNNGKNLRVCVDKSKFVDLESFKSKIIELYNEGTPVVVYYKLVTPTRLAFTDEQKAVAKELNNARTYKNVTNITTDSKAILSLDYAKDLETLLNNTQALAVNNASEGV